jgi:vacuolar-type H+-ATPase subunit H
MASFEQMGRQLDRELERLREVAKKKIKPETRTKAAKVLRSASNRLATLADDIEAKMVTKEP